MRINVSQQKLKRKSKSEKSDPMASFPSIFTVRKKAREPSDRRRSERKLDDTGTAYAQDERRRKPSTNKAGRWIKVKPVGANIMGCPRRKVTRPIRELLLVRKCVLRVSRKFELEKNSVGKEMKSRLSIARNGT
ncbi:hypothetical protein TNCV_4286401 [Trichonephila clavipes]|nr:hypothetical protein TNCV_4286401 [Trichonephila clavipes]